MDALSTLLQQTQYLTKTQFFTLKTAGNWAYSITNKNMMYFYLVQSGSFCIKIGDVLRVAYAGDIIMIPNANKHICHARGHHGDNAKSLDKNISNYDQGTINFTKSSVLDTQLILIECQYDEDLFRPLILALPLILPEHEDMDISQFQAIGRAVSFMALEFEFNRLGRLAMINEWASIVMIECLRTYIEGLPETADNWLTVMIDPHLSKALRVMHESPNISWTTRDLAKEAGMSRSGFTQRFKDIVGIPPLTYLTDYRLRIAARRLRLQRSSIAQIGEMVGYSSHSTFSQAFKRVYEMSPSEYRKQQKDRN
ncbi:helix-turn-helix transcriptional regulator [uncultured Psychrobacter sp.]|uniref:helix-turn-helix transcriptional regulator n=1 Tax=uncultured Psychrobacter sp. TaxID=259303 RepID=UPI0034585716